jgi:hypothetical protein
MYQRRIIWGSIGKKHALQLVALVLSQQQQNEESKSQSTDQPPPP